MTAQKVPPLCQKQEMENERWVKEYVDLSVYNMFLPDVTAQLLSRPTQAHGGGVNGFLMPANRSGI